MRPSLLLALLIALNACHVGASDANAPDASDSGTTFATDTTNACGTACPGAAPLCDPARRLCVQCMVDSHCGAARPACDPSGECRECVDDSHCFGDRPICDINEQTCVSACEADEDCADDQESSRFCDTVSGHCLQCRDSMDCESDDDRRVCNPSGQCAECEADTDCRGDAAVCDAAQGRCADCRNDDQCETGRCVDFECVECLTDEDCADGERCDEQDCD